MDNAYPLYGAVTLDPQMPLADALAEKDGLWGAAIDNGLLARLHVAVGDTIKIGEATFQIRAVITHEPDAAITFATAGPRVMIAATAVPATELVQTGTLGEYIYNIRLKAGESAADLRLRLEREFPAAGWRLRGLSQAAQGLDGFLDNVTLFLTLIGLTALLTGGIGVANAVRAHLASRMNTIAVLKCLGAPADSVFAIYLIQLGLLAAGGHRHRPRPRRDGAVRRRPQPRRPAAGAAAFRRLSIGFVSGPVFGVLTSALFGLWPLARARDIPAVALFRNIFATSGRGRRRNGTWR